MKLQVEKLNLEFSGKEILHDISFSIQEGEFVSILGLNIPWWRSHPIHENRATESICTEPCNPLLRATKSMKRATSTY